MANKSLRIVHCANFSENKFGAVYYATDRKISNGFIRNGHMVYDFSYRDVARHEAPLAIKRLGIRKMNQRLVETVLETEADLLLLGHTELVTNETLGELRRLRPSLKLAMWWVDPLDGFLIDKAFFEARINLLDHFFLTTDPDELCSFLDLSVDSNQLHFLPNICDATIDTGNAYKTENPRHELLFIGRRVSSRGELISFLETQLSDVNVGIYGQTRDNLVLGHNYIELLTHSPMAINYSRMNDISLYSSDRQVHLAANGCLTFTPDTPKMKSVFTEDEMVYFTNFSDLETKVRYFLSHKEEGRKIAMAGQKRARANYDCVTITEQMLKTIQD